MKPVLYLALLSLPLLPATSRYDRLPAKQKIQMIETGKMPAGTQVTFNEKELNAYVRVRAVEVVPEGLRDPRVEIADNRATGYATVNLAKMRHAQGQNMGRLMNWLLDGERPMKVTGRLNSSNGVGRVDLERVEIGGNVIEGRALDLLIRTFVTPLYPQAKVAQDFELGYRMDRIELRRGLARVIMTPKKAARTD